MKSAAQVSIRSTLFWPAAYNARVILLHAANHFVSFSEWKIKGNLRGGGEKLSLAWNVGSISIFLLFI